MAGTLRLSNTGTGNGQSTITTAAAGDTTYTLPSGGGTFVTTTSTEALTVPFASGTAGAPSVTFIGDTDTGLYSPSANNVAISTNGTGRLFVDANGNVGVGTNLPAVELHVHSTSQNPAVQITRGAVGSEYGYALYGADGATSAALRFFTIENGAGTGEKMRLDSSGRLGIGTASPTQVLHLATPSSTDCYIRLENSSSSTGYIGYRSSALTFETANIERARITSDGKLGLGTSTPGSYGASADNFVVYDAGNAGITIAGGVSDYSSIFFADGTSGAAQYAGYFQYNHADDKLYIGSGANTTITCDSSQRVGIGTTSPSSLLAVHQASASTSNYINITNDATGTSSLLNGMLVGVSDSGAALCWQNENLDLLFGTNNNERARIDSSGRLLVGTSSSLGGGARLQAKGSTADGTTYGVQFFNSSDATLFAARTDGLLLTGTAASSPYNNTTGGAANIVVDSNGILYRSTSSLKYKENVQDTEHGLAELLQLRPVTYTGKSESDGSTVFGGLIAEEVDAIGLSEFVQYAEDGSPDALAYSNMVSLCIKAIQEQQAMITELQTKVAALEGV